MWYLFALGPLLTLPSLDVDPVSPGPLPGARRLLEPVDDAPPAPGEPEQVARAHVEARRARLGLGALELGPATPRHTRLGTWWHFAVSWRGIPVLDRSVGVHLDSDGRVDRLSAHLPAPRARGDWHLDARAALLAATRQARALVVADPSVERRPGSVARAWFDDGAGLVPVFVVTPRSLHPLERPELVIDARDGRALRQRERVRRIADFACARVFTPTPGANLDEGDAQETLLPFAAPSAEGYLRGPFFETFNCCRQVDCDPEGPESRSQGSIPNPLGVGADPIYYDIVTCSEHPKARAEDGYFLFDPVDPLPGSPDYDAALEDPFAEGHLYFSAQNLFSYLRQIGDPGLLLRAHGGSADAPAAPFHLTANLVVPDFEQAYQQIAPWPLGQGRGAQDNPVVIDDFMRIANAAYIPAATPGTQPLPIDIFDRDFDSVVMFQGDERDFTYDGDVIYHELTHAVIGSTVDLTNATYDEQGALLSPGSLNEGYADYFAATLANDSLTGEYGGHTAGEEGGIRDADNDRACPEDLTGEVHDDSWPWSGALWELRDIFVGESCDRDRFDAAIYDGLMALPHAATYDQAAEATALALAQAYGRDSGAYQIARCVFERRGMQGCQRVLRILEVSATGSTVSRPLALLYASGGGELGLAEAPAQTQLRIDVPKGTTRFTLSWTEGSGGMDAFFGGTPSFEVLVKRGGPIRYSYSGGQVQHDADQRLAVTRSGGGLGQPPQVQPLEVEVDEPCGQSYFAAFINPGGTAALSSIRASASVDPERAAACDGELDVLPAPGRPTPAACAALPASIGDSEQCTLAPPHGVEPCPARIVPEPPAPEPVDGCDCRGSRQAPWAVLIPALLVLGWRRRR